MKGGPERMEEIIRNGDADFISLSRPLIREPGIINEWKSGNRHRAYLYIMQSVLGSAQKGRWLAVRSKKP